MSQRVQKGQRITLELGGVDVDGEAWGQVKETELRLTGAYPGELVEVELAHVSPHTLKAWAELLKILRPSPQRRRSPCAHRPACAGCPLIELDEAAQLRSKAATLARALSGLVDASLLPERCLATPPAWAYRRRAKFVVFRQDGHLRLGAYQRRSHDPVGTETCEVVSPAIRQALTPLARTLAQQGVAIDGEGGVGLRFVQLRSNFAGALLLTLVVRKMDPSLATLAKLLAQVIPALSGVSVDVNPGSGDNILAGQSQLLWGQGVLPERLGGLELALDAYAFSQIHGPAGERLAQAASDLIDFKPGAWVADLYAGLGQMAFYLARQHSQVVAVERVASAVQQGQQAAQAAGLAVKFICADSADWLQEMAGQTDAPHAVVIDPPRRGLSASALAGILALRPAQIVYVSCQPKSLARDLNELLQQGYVVTTVKAFDLFPQTAAVESIVKLVDGQI